MKVVFAPFGPESPYQSSLKSSLRELGVKVVPVNKGLFTFLKNRDWLQADIIHFHWIEFYVGSPHFLKALFKMILLLSGLAILKRKKFVWTAHNFWSHENQHPKLERWFLRRFLAFQQAISVHNQYTRDRLANEFGVDSQKIHVIPHANFLGYYPSFKNDLSYFKKEVFGHSETKFTFGFLGKIRPYKGVMNIIESFKKLSLPNKQLLICGQVKYPEDALDLEAAVSGYEDIILKLGYVDEKEMEAYLQIIDVMIYPYRSIVTSGSLLLGMTHRKLCLVSEVGSMSEFIDSRYRFVGSEQLTQKMAEVMQMSPVEIDLEGDRNYAWIQDDTWDRMALKTQEMYDDIRA